MINQQLKLNQLLAELCPEGVEFEKLGAVCEVLRWKRLTKSQLSDDGQYTVYHGWLIPLGYYHEYNREANTVMVINTWSVWEVWWSAEPFWSSDGTFTIKCPDFIQDKYLYYFLKTKEKSLKKEIRSGWVPTIDRLTVEKQTIPIPPLPVQEEIVRILDKFTSLEARKCQYEFYRNQLLAFDKDEIVWKTLGEIATIQRGASPRPIQSYLTDQEDWIPWIKIGDTNVNSKYIYSTEQKITKEGAEKSRILKKWDFILSNSMSFGRPYILQIDGAIHDGWASISNFDKYLNADFLYYYLSSSIVQNYRNTKINTSSVSNLNSEIIKSLQIPLPPLEQQEAIVYILDHFDQLANDLTAGLPAELHLRQQQYAYYRDMLLNFSSELVSERERVK